jgi:hypothetical protein
LVCVDLRALIKDTKIGLGDNLGHQCFWARSVGHPQAEPAVQLGPIARVGIAEQAEKVVERLGYGVEWSAVIRCGGASVWPSRACGAFFVVVVSVIHSAMTAGSPPTSRVAR